METRNGEYGKEVCFRSSRDPRANNTRCMLIFVVRVLLRKKRRREDTTTRQSPYPLKMQRIVIPRWDSMERPKTKTIVHFSNSHHLKYLWEVFPLLIKNIAHLLLEYPVSKLEYIAYANRESGKGRVAASAETGYLYVSNHFLCFHTSTSNIQQQEETDAMTVSFLISEDLVGSFVF